MLKPQWPVARVATEEHGFRRGVIEPWASAHSTSLGQDFAPRAKLLDVQKQNP